MNKTVAEKIVKQLKKIYLKYASDATFRSMYGGTVIELVKNEPKSLAGGIFVYENHVSLELTKGSSVVDPNCVLEGTGKLRRHVKIHAIDDIKSKGCEGLIRQSLSLI